ncbi:MAG: hypothetical protein ACKPKO_22980, partial [Candidatus Fonsibacter sp.]
MELPSSRIFDEACLVSFSGDEVMDMANNAMAILQQKSILLRVSKNRAQEHIKPASIVAAKLAFV